MRCRVVVMAAVAVACHPEEPDLLPDLTVDAARMERSAYFEWRRFTEADCAMAEACVLAPGWRRLLRFTTEIRNVGTAPVVLGSPEDNPIFAFDECHEHYHRQDSLDYELFSADGESMTVGRKQSYCWVDSEPILDMPLTDPLFPNDGAACMGNQGLTNGWSDVYGHDLDCQWVDVTGLPAGEYRLRVTVNPDASVAESRLDNNVAEVMITLRGPRPIDHPLPPD